MVKLNVLSNGQDCRLNSTYYKHQIAVINNKIAMAKWDENIFGSSTVLPQLFVNPIDGTLRPVRINYFFKLSFIVSEPWFQPHPW